MSVLLQQMHTQLRMELKVMKWLQSPLKDASIIYFTYFVMWKIIQFKVK